MLPSCLVRSQNLQTECSKFQTQFSDAMCTSCLVYKDANSTHSQNRPISKYKENTCVHYAAVHKIMFTFSISRGLWQFQMIWSPDGSILCVTLLKVALRQHRESLSSINVVWGNRCACSELNQIIYELLH